MGERQNVLYREIQRPRQLWLLVIVVGIAILMWYGFMRQIIYDIPFGDNPAPNSILIVFWVTFGVLFPIVFLFMMKLIVEVREDGIYVRYVPFHFQYKQFRFQDIRQTKKMEYHPIKQFGGWGIRYNADGEKAYNMSGTFGIKLNTKQQTIIIGTKQPDIFIRAIQMAQQNKMNRSI